jgi:hypothetical protein
MRSALARPLSIPPTSQRKEMSASEVELTVLLYEFKDLNTHRGPSASAPVRSLANLIAFNGRSEEMPL